MRAKVHSVRDASGELIKTIDDGSRDELLRRNMVEQRRRSLLALVPTSDILLLLRSRTNGSITTVVTGTLQSSTMHVALRNRFKA